jgi:putative aldouronate transport system permease protein
MEKIHYSKFRSLSKTISKDFVRNKYLYLMALPVLAYYILFHYQPMYGAIIAFKDFSPAKGIIGSDWVGLDNFKSFFRSFYFVRVVRNTILISLYNLMFGFPCPIILALLINEIRSNKFKRTVQTISYLPHFISVMVVCGLIVDYTSSNGVINDIIAAFGGKRVSLLLKPELFRTIYIGTDGIRSSIWRPLWRSIRNSMKRQE